MVGAEARETEYVLSYESLARDCATGANAGYHQPSYGCVPWFQPLFAPLS